MREYRQSRPILLSAERNHRWQVVLRVLSKERANTRLTARVRTCGDCDTRFWLVAATPDATVEILDRLDHLARTRRLPN